ncbi:MFS transporter [Streptomyces olivaceoviridis]|uniref:hypothetical protein n=1 Tax=Streptomyces olivaceoviridis TaxID=1921 RepID=UPI0036FDB660
MDGTRRTSFGGALVAALLVPGVIAAPLTGALADRVRRRRLFHGGCLVFHGTGLAAVAMLAGRASAPVVLAVAGAAGCRTPLLTGGLTSIPGDLLPPTALNRAFNLDDVSCNLAGIAGRPLPLPSRRQPVPPAPSWHWAPQPPQAVCSSSPYR